MIGAVVLAGRANQGKLREASEAEWEAWIPIGGRPMVAWVLDALWGAPGVEEVVVVGPRPPGNGIDARTRFLEPGASLVENLRRGAEAAHGEELLVATGDVPLITADDVAHFLERARAAGADLAYPIVTREACEAAYPGVARTYVRVGGRRYTGGNLFYLKREALDRVWPFLDRVYAARKRPLTLLPLFGARIALGALLGRVSIGAIERRVERIAGLRGRAVVTDRAAIAVDVDKPEDLDLARRVLGSAARRPPAAGERL
ncbi:MAG: NTP transferase domain-containing protein [Firmicutes bacterium]|nr:NTP transferase domain-containing protein [Bacillota bacterium]